MEKMTKINTPEVLEKLISNLTKKLNDKIDGKAGIRKIVICGGTGCLSSNSKQIYEEFFNNSFNIFYLNHSLKFILKILYIMQLNLVIVLRLLNPILSIIKLLKNYFTLIQVLIKK